MNEHGVLVESHWQGKTEEYEKYKKKYPISTSSNTNLTWISLGLGQSLLGDRPTTNSLMYGRASVI
jgi:hypothetical protein